MMGDDDRDPGDIAEQLANALTSIEDFFGWTFEGRDIGEIDVTTPAGQRFRMTVEELQND